ncbi:hypothetical protein AAVH_12189 [Aphelenchoides avenae]|nr:hypothetical protein AAVH_12189 [Aphelenchus avenae]
MFSVKTSKKFGAMILLVAVSIHSGAQALICYETDKEGVRHVVENDAWKYCAVVPASHTGQGLQSGRAFGVGPDTDVTDYYDINFVPSDKAYKVLSICIYEKYAFGRQHRVRANWEEFLFRCVCDYDLCNSETTFGDFLAALH